MLNLRTDEFPSELQRRNFYVWRLEDLLRDMQRARVDPNYKDPGGSTIRGAFEQMMAAWYRIEPTDSPTSYVETPAGRYVPGWDPEPPEPMSEAARPEDEALIDEDPGPPFDVRTHPHIRVSTPAETVHAHVESTRPKRRLHDRRQNTADNPALEHARKLSENQVREIRNSNLPMSQLAEMFNVSTSAVSKVFRRETYKWVED
jgi:DNA-binding transcriptional regulator YiaG